MLTNSTISGNSTTGYEADGGGFSASGVTTLTNSTVSGNSTTGYNADGGGFSALGASTTLTNSTVSSNSTAGGFADGGGFVARYSVIIGNSTITQNAANHANAVGDGVFLRSFDLETFSLSSTILSSNAMDNFAFITGFAPTLNVSNSLFGDDASEINGTNIANVISNIPRLAPLADNGCATPAGAPATAACVQTHGILAGSLALDAGAANGLTTDQRGMGFPRVINGQADIGAFEGIVAAPLEEDIPTLNIWMLGLLGLLLGFVTRIKGRISK